MKKLPSILVFWLFAALAAASAQSAPPAATDATTPVLTIPSTFSPPANTSGSNTTPSGTPGVASAPMPAASLPGISFEHEPADPAAAFSAGLAAYAKGDFARARSAFGAAELKAVSPALEYNFGNACYSAGDFGEAILHYLRSLSLNPHDPDARQNLALARQALNLSEPAPAWLDRYSGALTENTWTWLATLAGWSAIYLAFLPRLYRWSGATPKLLCAAMALLAIGAGLGVWGVKLHDHDGVVVRADTPLKLSPTADSGSIGLVQSGEIAQVLDEHGDYYKVLTADGHLGWVDNTRYAPVWE